MRILVTALAVVCLGLAGCTHDKELKESPEQIRQEQVTADRNNASTSTTSDPGAPLTSDTTLVTGSD